MTNAELLAYEWGRQLVHWPQYDLEAASMFHPNIAHLLTGDVRQAFERLGRDSFWRWALRGLGDMSATGEE